MLTKDVDKRCRSCPALLAHAWFERETASDEELADMIQHQKAYEASARYVSTVDEMMQTLINM